MVPIPQTGIAGTLNLSEELFPDGKQQRYETETDRKETDCRGGNKWKKERAESAQKGEKVAGK